jgi:hypothetical protein
MPKRSATGTIPRNAAPALCPVDSPSADFEELIRRRAYELYELRGRVDGFAQEDWLQAERELRVSQSKTATA